MNKIKIDQSVLNKIRCPSCKEKIKKLNSKLVCLNKKCKKTYPIIDGIPILLDKDKSLFRVSKSNYKKESFFYEPSKNLFKTFIRKITPTISLNLKAEENYKMFSKALLKEIKKPRVLVVGGSIVGSGMNRLFMYENIEFIETDISIGDRNQIVCDSHQIPFADESFDGVIIQAVLEHVLDPQLCVKERHRILKKNGIVYAETPFMQQVHGGKYDFQRFSLLGHRRLFRCFTCIRDGAVGGPGMALAWSLKYFLLSFTKSKKIRTFLDTFSDFISFGLKYFDFYLINKPGSLDAASGLFFLGRKSKICLKDVDLIKMYRGTNF